MAGVCVVSEDFLYFWRWQKMGVRMCRQMSRSGMKGVLVIVGGNQPHIIVSLNLGQLTPSLWRVCGSVYVSVWSTEELCVWYVCRILCMWGWCDIKDSRVSLRWIICMSCASMCVSEGEQSICSRMNQVCVVSIGSLDCPGFSGSMKGPSCWNG